MTQTIERQVQDGLEAEAARAILLGDDERRTVAVGFDGVLHSYTSGWQGPLAIPDPPIDGAIAWLNDVSAAGYDVHVITPRARHEGSAAAIIVWLRDHGYTGRVPLVMERFPHVVYVERTAYRFKGRFPTIRQIRYGLKPWQPGDRPRTFDQEKANRHADYVAKLERSNGRLRQERARLYDELVRVTLKAAGCHAEVADEFLRQYADQPFELRLEAARRYLADVEAEDADEHEGGARL